MDPTVPDPHASPKRRPKRSGLTTVVLIAIFFASVVGGMKLGVQIADAVVLRDVYGKERLAREQLEIVSLKPELKVSNGDVLAGYGLWHTCIGVVVFIATPVVAFPVALRLLPAEMRREADNGKGMETEKLGYVAVPVIFAVAAFLVLTKSLWPNAIIFAAALALAWSLRRQK